MELGKSKKKYNKLFKKSNLNNEVKDQFKVTQKNNFLPLPWKIWPYEGQLIFILLMVWCILGLFILGSASWWVASKEIGEWSFYLKRQSIWISVGLLTFSWVVNNNIRDLLKISKYIFYILLISVGATILFGSTINGSSRWLLLGPFQIQPSELIKPFLILESANLFAHWNLVKSEKKFTSLSLFGLLIFLIMLQPNLSTAGLTGLLIWIIALCGGVRLKSLFSVALLGFITGYISILSNEYQKIRVLSFINPWNDPEGYGYQLIQSLLAIGSGGLFGQGFGLSMQKLQYLPIQSTDFIFAIFAEEFGFLGSTLFLGFLSLFSYLSLRIAFRCRNNYSKLVAIGSGTLLVGQSIMHIAVATGSMPTTGLPLPFVSYGGNSLLSSLFIGGLLVRCSIESTGLLGRLSARKSIG